VTTLTSRELHEDDFYFLKEIITASSEWQKEECHVNELKSYLLSYKMYNGEWRIWSIDNKHVGISYVLEWSPANEKPWVGTILVHPMAQRKGIGKNIVNTIGFELSLRGHKALFAACPTKQDSWLQFLGKCGFEQFKIEQDVSTSKDYMITVKPLL
jgi:GNAT superfamily N-acetyltransferase